MSQPTPRQSIRRAEKLWHAGTPEKALDVLRQGRQSYPDSIPLLIHTAFRLSLYGEHQEAIDLLYKQLGQDQTNIKVLVSLANTYRRAGNLKNARLVAQQGMAIAGYDVSCAHTLGNIYIQNGEYSQALALAKTGLSVYSQDKKLLHIMAKAYLGIGDGNAFDRVHAQLSDDDPVKFFLLAKKYYMRDQVKKALDVLTQAMTQSFNEEACILYLSMISPTDDNPIVPLIRDHMKHDNHRFESVFDTAERMRKSRQVFLAFDEPMPKISPVLRDPRYTVAGGINKAALKDGGLPKYIT